jgi:ribonuclease BN (tRNA processing enzyme)
MKYVHRCYSLPSFLATPDSTNKEVLDEVFKYLTLTGHVECSTEEASNITAFPTIHTDIPSVGYVVPGYGIFTGDTKPCQAVVDAWHEGRPTIYHDVQLNGQNPLTTPHTTLDELLFYYDPNMIFLLCER